MLSILMKNQCTTGERKDDRLILVSQIEDNSYEKSSQIDPIIYEMQKINYQPFYGFSMVRSAGMTTAASVNTYLFEAGTTAGVIFKRLLNKITHPYSSTEQSKCIHSRWGIERSFSNV